MAIGGIFGVGFLREYLKDEATEHVIEHDKQVISDEKKLLKAYNSELVALHEKSGKDKADYKRIVELFQLIDEEETKIKEAKKEIKTAKKIQYVKRDTLKKIVAAWIITVPIAAVLSALVFFMIKGIVL
ncbi:MAG: hypothetical protein CSA19_01765 [Deltaproteobacteria bacterium]|nr:MAG: hypothetical protein CSA19_01765 [Deltaproteobacteria bacterium]